MWCVAVNCDDHDNDDDGDDSYIYLSGMLAVMRSV